MALHQDNPNKQSDDMFTKGNYSYLVEGNECRLLDGRRTPGYIEAINPKSGMFIWRITDFEDKGEMWELPFYKVFNFQFVLDADQLDEETSLAYKAIDDSFGSDISIIGTETSRSNTESIISELKIKTDQWIKDNHVLQEFISSFNLEDLNHVNKVAQEFQKYMDLHNLLELEKRTAHAMVLNPQSGEWVKGMEIVLGELGLVTCQVKAIRKEDTFEGMGSKAKRKAYIYHRLAFVRSLFEALNLNEPTLYRGMASEKTWSNIKRTFLNMTFSKDVAEAFASFNNEKYKSAYIMRTSVNKRDIFMTYIETQEMNQQYKEREAVLLCKEPLCI